MKAEIKTPTSTRVPRGLTELMTLSGTLKRRAGRILAYFDHPHTSNGPAEAINGRLEHLRGSALGFRNRTHYITRALLETGGFKPQPHPQIMKSRSFVSLLAKRDTCASRPLWQTLTRVGKDRTVSAHVSQTGRRVHKNTLKICMSKIVADEQQRKASSFRSSVD